MSVAPGTECPHADETAALKVGSERVEMILLPLLKRLPVRRMAFRPSDLLT